MSGIAFPRIDHRILADDGDELNFCSTCAFSQACLSQGMDKSALMDLHMLVEHVGPLHAGEHVFREGDPFEAIAAVRAGTVKTYMIDRDGHEHVLGFHLPGELFGLDAIGSGKHRCEAIALGEARVCELPFATLSTVAAQLPSLQRQLLRVMGQSADRDHDHVDVLSRRLAARGFSPDRFQLTMARTDIANYLRLAPETISRVLKRFQDDGLLKVDRRELELLGRDRLEALADPVLHR